MIDYMYRYESTYYCEEYDIFSPILRFKLKKYRVIKETKCGVWIRIRIPGYPDYKKKFINTNYKKQFAYKTKELALEGYLARKYRQIAIISDQLEHAKEAIKHLRENEGFPNAYEYMG